MQWCGGGCAAVSRWVYFLFLFFCLLLLLYLFIFSSFTVYRGCGGRQRERLALCVVYIRLYFAAAAGQPLLPHCVCVCSVFCVLYNVYIFILYLRRCCCCAVASRHFSHGGSFLHLAGFVYLYPSVCVFLWVKLFTINFLSALLCSLVSLSLSPLLTLVYCY